MKIEELLIKHEGLKLKPYKDTKGIITIGVGRNLEDNGIEQDEALYMLKNDIKKAKQELREIFEGFNKLPDNVRLVLIDMIFNLGKTRFLKFRHMIQAVKNRNWENMIKEMKNSKWCEELKNRCGDDVELIQHLLTIQTS